MTVYNIGLPRTATRSITNLFLQIGFLPQHAMLSHGYNFEIGHVLNNLDQFKKPNTFYSDTPIWHPAFWEMANLKDQLVIRTYREKESWINSVMNFNYFKQQDYFNQDKYWFKDYFDHINVRSLSKTYDDHSMLSNYFNNIISIDMTNDQPDLIIDRICSHLKIERKLHYELRVIGKNPHKKPVAI